MHTRENRKDGEAQRKKLNGIFVLSPKRSIINIHTQRSVISNYIFEGGGGQWVQVRERERERTPMQNSVKQMDPFSEYV